MILKPSKAVRFNKRSKQGQNKAKKAKTWFGKCLRWLTKLHVHSSPCHSQVFKLLWAWKFNFLAFIRPSFGLGFHTLVTSLRSDWPWYEIPGLIPALFRPQKWIYRSQKFKNLFVTVRSEQRTIEFLRTFLKVSKTFKSYFNVENSTFIRLFIIIRNSGFIVVILGLFFHECWPNKSLDHPDRWIEFSAILTSKNK